MLTPEGLGNQWGEFTHIGISDSLGIVASRAWWCGPLWIAFQRTWLRDRRRLTIVLGVIPIQSADPFRSSNFWVKS